jgi:hypothetical protein
VNKLRTLGRSLFTHWSVGWAQLGESGHYRTQAVNVTSRPPVLRVALLVGVALFGLSACRSQPSAHRVADDLINTLAKTDAERTCMLGKIDAYSKGELEQLGNDSLSSDKATKAKADAELAKLQKELESCR